MFSPRLALDPSLYRLSPAQVAFFKSQTKIEDDDELKDHILKVQGKAYQVFPYPCIRQFSFTAMTISRLPAYQDALKLGKERKGAILLDMACCFGNDARVAIADGFPISQVVCADIKRELFQYGHELFRSSHETFPIPFIEGDVFDSNFISPRKPFYASDDIPSMPPVASLHNGTSLSPIQGHVSALHVSKLFHIFDEQSQFEVAQKLASLLSPEPGSLIFGTHVGQEEAGTRKRKGDGQEAFAHSPESWIALWNGQIFKQGTVEVKAVLMDRLDLEGFTVPTDSKSEGTYLTWSITRL